MPALVEYPPLDARKGHPIPPDHRETVRVRLVMDAITVLFAREHAVLQGTEP